MRKTVFFSLFLSFITASAFSQTGSVTGVVTDSLTGQPVVNLSVFIPFSTSGTTTNQKGEYHLDQLKPGDYLLMFRHLSYPSYSRFVTIEPGKQVVLNVVIAEQSRKLKEVVVVGKLPDRRMGMYLFNKYFLGDEFETSCILENPRDLSFYYDGDVLNVAAKKPLKIINRHLGYRITYFLDYFKFEKKNSESTIDEGGYFGYAGNALFEDLSSVMPLKAIGWKINRNGEFKGSIRHFLVCLYQNKLAQMDSLFTWHSVSEKTEIIFYYPFEEYVLNGIEVKDGPESGTKTLSTDAFLLVFSDYRKTKDLRDDWISTLRIPEGGIIFDKDGNYWVHKGALSWINLDNTLQIKRLLPFDYLPKMKPAHL